MAGFSKIYCIGGLGGYMGSDGINPIYCQIWLGEGSRQWMEAYYFEGHFKPLGKVMKIIPQGPDHPDSLLDACIAFFPEHFRSCPLLTVVEEQLVDVESLDFSMNDNIPPEWRELRKQARPFLASLNIFEADLIERGSKPITRRRVKAVKGTKC